MQGEAARRGLPLAVGGVREGLVAGLITACALALRLLGVGRGLPYLHEWDEVFVLPHVITMVRDHTLNPGIFFYGTLYYYLLCPVVYAHALYLHARGILPSIQDVVLAHPLVPGYLWYLSVPSFYFWARAFTAMLGAATVYLVYRLGDAAFGRPVGLLAAALLAAAPGAVYYADTVRVDVPEAFFTTAALLAGLGVLRRGRRRDYLAAGLLTGLAISTKQTAIWLLAPLVTAHVFNERRTVFVDAALACMALGVIAGGVLGTPYALFHPGEVWAGFTWHTESYGLLALPWPAEYLSKLGLNLAYLVWPIQGGDWYIVPHAGIGLLPGIAALAGVVVGFRRQRSVQRYLVAFPLVQLLFLARANVFYTRNLMPVLPLVSIWAALGAVWAWERAARRTPPWWRGSPRSWRSAAAAVGIAILLIGPAWESAALGWWLYSHRDTRTQAVEWLRRHVPRGAAVAFELELAWYLPDLDGLPFRMEWTDRRTPLSWYSEKRIAYAAVSEWNPVNVCPAAKFFPRPPYLPSVAQEAKFVPDSYPIIDPAVAIVRPRARCPSTAPAQSGPGRLPVVRFRR
ncbi:MAG TPA: glycosyltransferase family 39 protein [bacterium]|nr:glycosyltransferase family 39 protein [bacterium]